MWGKSLMVGLSGASCGGKTTVSKLLQASFPWAWAFHQDAYFHPNEGKYHVFVPEVNHFDWDLKSALDLNKMDSDFTRMKRTEKEQLFAEKARFFSNDDFVKKHGPDESTVDYLTSRYGSIPLIIVEGHILFHLKPFYDMGFFLHLDREECGRRRGDRVYDPPNPPRFFEICVWPDYVKRLEEVGKLEGIEYFDAKNVPLVDIYKRILTSMTKRMDQLNSAVIPANNTNTKDPSTNSKKSIIFPRQNHREAS